MNVAVVIPAHDAEETLGQTLGSLAAQTFSAWEAVVVDDGSRDDTAAVARRFAEPDSRIRVLHLSGAGPSGARNAGIAATSAPWLLFLDADDWLAPEHLQRLVGALEANRSLDAAFCRWARVSPEGESLPEGFPGRPHELVSVLRTRCPFAIHACVVARSAVRSVGGFDPGLRTCEDWDLWQRIVRAGARFATLPEVLAYYRMRRGSLSVDPDRLLHDGLRVIARGHAADRRIPGGPGRDAPRLCPGDLEDARLRFLCWPAGLALGAGADPRGLMEAVRSDRQPGLHPEPVAQSIFEAALLPECLGASGWDVLWPRVEGRLDAFLSALEEQSAARGLARRARRCLERLVVRHSQASRPRTLGGTHGVRVEVTGPIGDVTLPAGAERVQCAVTIDGVLLGEVELPVTGTRLRAYVLSDAIASEFAWPILGGFFERTIYRRTDGAPDAEEPRTLHDRVGWGVFLQEVWHRPDWPAACFYDPCFDAGPGPRREVARDRVVLEVGADVPDLDVPDGAVTVDVRVAGVALGSVRVVADGGRVSAQALRAAVTTATGFELCVAVVREALLGRPFSAPGSLGDRLMKAAAVVPHADASVSRVPGDPALASGWSAAVARALGAGNGGRVIGRRAVGTIESAVSRRAALPAGAADDVLASARTNGEPVVEAPGPAAADLVYAPDLLWGAPAAQDAGPARSFRSGARAIAQPYGRHDFERLFARGPDPWHYTSEYERVKYAQTLSLLPPGPIARALEVGCAEGHFTAELASRVGQLVAADISTVALERARRRAASAPNVEFVRIDLRQDPLPGPFDLIVCSELLYYMGDADTLRGVAARMAQALRPGGHIVTAHANLVDEEPGAPGFDWDVPFGARVIGDTFAAQPALAFVTELRTVPYRIQVFCRDDAVAPRAPGGSPRGPATVLRAASGAMEPQVAAGLVERPSRARARAAEVTTERLPILMYHRVASGGPAATLRYRVTPEMFEAQLSYLRDAGFHGIELEEWTAALEARRPLPGRAVLLTFDDGYRDFAACAWPLLERYGFGATVFLVAERIGGTNVWDAETGDEVPLMGWKEIARLQGQGVRFGSHSATHAALTALSPAEIVREAAASRAAIERGLGVPVTAFAYPYGDVDRVAQHLVGACGYVVGLSCRPGASGPRDSPLSLPRIEIGGNDTLEDFVVKLDG